MLDRACTASYPVKPVLNWANCLFAEHTSDSSTNDTLFPIELRVTSSSPNIVRTVRRIILREVQASARTLGRSTADSTIQTVG